VEPSSASGIRIDRVLSTADTDDHLVGVLGDPIDELSVSVVNRLIASSVARTPIRERDRRGRSQSGHKS
jgi:hypothetical protein